MSLCPAFYCSRCNASHADECPPPLKKAMAKLPDIDFECKGGCGLITANLSGTCTPCQKAKNYAGPVVGGVSTQIQAPPAHPTLSPQTMYVLMYAVSVGSIWRSYSRRFANDPWQLGNPSCDYEVIRTGPNVVVRPTGLGSTNTMDFDWEHWTSDGHPYMGIHLKFELVP